MLGSNSPCATFGVPWRDLTLIALSAAYFVAVGAFELSPGALVLLERPIERQALAVEPLARMSLQTRLSVEVAPDWYDAMPELGSESPSDEAYMIFPETPARERARDRARLAGRHVARSHADRRSGGSGARARLLEGPIGNPDELVAQGSWSIRAADARKRRPARTSRWPSAGPHGFSVVGFGSPPGWGSPDEDAGEQQFTAPWGDDDGAGDDDFDVVGNMFAPEPTDPYGAGLGAVGIGPGGSGRAQRIGLGSSGELGHGSGVAAAQGTGVADITAFGRDASVGIHEPRSPQLATRVPPDTVQRVLRRNAGRLAACPGGAAFVALSFTIAPNGTTSDVAVEPDGALPAPTELCLRRAVSELRFHSTASTPVRVVARRAGAELTATGTAPLLP